MNNYVNLDSISLKHFRLYPIIGLLPKERLQPQAVDLSCTLKLDLEGVARQESLGIDYAEVAEWTEFLLTKGRFELLETAAHCWLWLAFQLYGASSGLRLAQVSFCKPDILPGALAPEVSMSRALGSWNLVDSDLRDSPTKTVSLSYATFRLTVLSHIRHQLTETCNARDGALHAVGKKACIRIEPLT